MCLDSLVVPIFPLHSRVHQQHLLRSLHPRSTSPVIWLMKFSESVCVGTYVLILSIWPWPICPNMYYYYYMWPVYYYTYYYLLHWEWIPGKIDLNIATWDWTLEVNIPVVLFVNVISYVCVCVYLHGQCSQALQKIVGCSRDFLNEFGVRPHILLLERKGIFTMLQRFYTVFLICVHINTSW